MTYRRIMFQPGFGSGGGNPSWDQVSNKPSAYPPSSHTHSAIDIIGLPLGGDPWSFTKLANSSTISTVAYANVPGMSFLALALTTYLVELTGAYQTAATTTGIGLALDIPSGSVIGRVVGNTSATALTGLEQIADATATGVTTGVRAANTNTPITGRWVVAIGAIPGTVQLMQRSEVAGSNTTLQANLTIMGRRVIA